MPEEKKLVVVPYEAGQDCMRCGHEKGDEGRRCYVYGTSFGRHLYEKPSPEEHAQ